MPGYTSFFNFLRSFAVRIVEKIGNFPRFSRDYNLCIDGIIIIVIAFGIYNFFYTIPDLFEV